MATEVCSASPRFSFSEATSSTDVAGGGGPRRDGSPTLEPGSGDFNFSVSFQSSANDSSDADELFSDGKILPFFKTPPLPTECNPAPPPPLILDQRGGPRGIPESGGRSGDGDARAAFSRRGSGRQSIWPFGRSSSVGSVTSPGPISPLPLHRSRSTGSFPRPSQRLRQSAGNMAFNGKLASDLVKPKKTYYYSGSQAGSHRGGIRITPVLNLPAPMISRSSSGSGRSGGSSATASSLFTYLLCSCGGEERRDEIEAT